MTQNIRNVYCFLPYFLFSLHEILTNPKFILYFDRFNFNELSVDRYFVALNERSAPYYGFKFCFY